MLIPLVLGGTPGTFLGARMAAWVSQSVIRRGIVIVLTLTGLKMLGVAPEVVGIIGAGLLLLGPAGVGVLAPTKRPTRFRQQRCSLAPSGLDRERFARNSKEPLGLGTPMVVTRSLPS